MRKIKQLKCFTVIKYVNFFLKILYFTVFTLLFVVRDDTAHMMRWGGVGDKDIMTQYLASAQELFETVICWERERHSHLGNRVLTVSDL